MLNLSLKLIYNAGVIYIVNLKKVNEIKLECVEYDTVNPVIFEMI